MNIELGLMRFRDLLKVKREKGKRYIFDPIRKKWLVLLPEELVRQLVIHYLLEEKNYNRNRINLERGLRVNSLQKRFDLLVYDMEVNPFLLVECKAPQVPISQDVFHQAAIYNMELKVRYLLITNGIETLCCSIDYQKKSVEYLEAVPEYA
ncbi:MAG: type I restriction enzyme HsdR N-terminal domain-containing protein [Phaeodactylibacter sp.]|nr:type I restriction enzyme HsdR N-terminal domain-containing protein [Phaeodactylibacter sp.]MCB9265680.1 type I restriction enzyme HsdR N-terminal domain-containing protein [Lewinellaceae bacterium]MCB9288385.1 type I restriction enzyme HsdR N-terminal domain-containing protein [Lewinellaceae bacterium]